MPKGPRATGEIENERDELTSAAAQLGSKGGKKRAENMTPERRREIAQKAAQERWKKAEQEEAQRDQRQV